MQVSHAARAAAAHFDDPNLVSAVGLLPVMRLAERAGLRRLADQWLSVPTDKGANAGTKVQSLVAGMVAGADSIDDMALLRHGGMSKLFTSCYAPSTLGSFLRSFTFGHVRQLDAVAARVLVNLAQEAPIVLAPSDGGLVFVDVDDTIIEVHGYQKQGAGFGYSGVRGINALLATVSTSATAPVVIAQRLRKGASGSPRGAARIVADALKTVTRVSSQKSPVLLRADSAYYGFATVNAALTAGAAVSITARQDPAVKRAISTIPEQAWTPIEYTDAIFDEQARAWISKAEVAEVPFTAFTSRAKKDHVTGRLVVRRIPELNKKDVQHPTLFDTHRFHAFFTTSTLDTVTADQVHRRHAIIEQVNADLKHSALAHLPSGIFTANAAWLVLAVIAFNLTRAAATITGANLAKATTATIRRKLIAIPARVASSGRRIRLHLPRGLALGGRLDGVVRSRHRATPRLTHPSDQPTGASRKTSVEHHGQQGPRPRRAQQQRQAHSARGPPSPKNIGGSRLSPVTLRRRVCTSITRQLRHSKHFSMRPSVRSEPDVGGGCESDRLSRIDPE